MKYEVGLRSFPAAGRLFALVGNRTGQGDEYRLGYCPMDQIACLAALMFQESTVNTAGSDANPDSWCGCPCGTWDMLCL